MIDFKRMDDEDFVFINREPTEKERKAFSEFLRKKKEKGKRTGSYRKPEDLGKGLTAVREPKATYSTRRVSQAIPSVGKSKSKGTRKRAK